MERRSKLAIDKTVRWPEVLVGLWFLPPRGLPRADPRREAAEALGFPTPIRYNVEVGHVVAAGPHGASFCGFVSRPRLRRGAKPGRMLKGGSERG